MGSVTEVRLHCVVSHESFLHSYNSSLSRLSVAQPAEFCFLQKWSCFAVIDDRDGETPGRHTLCCCIHSEGSSKFFTGYLRPSLQVSAVCHNTFPRTVKD